MKIGIGADHGGFSVKEEIKKYLVSLNYDVIDYGTYTDESTDYPIYAKKVANAVVEKDVDFGILICKTGIGMSIAANKIKGIRCSKVDNEEEAFLTRKHNDSNVLALSAKKDLEEIKKIVKVYIESTFSNEERHIKRIKMIENDN